MKRSELKRTTPLARTPFKRTHPAKSKPQRSRRSPNEFSDEVKGAVRRRSGNRCEARCTKRCGGVARMFHHRKLRRAGDNRAVNCLHVCADCHTHIHDHPAEAYLRGWMVRQHADPAEVPVV